MRSSSCIPVVLFLLFCLSSAKESSNPQCNPVSGSGTESAIDFVFLLDHSLGADKVARIRYLYKAISCEIPTSKQYRLATVHVPGKSSKVDLAGWQTSAAFPDTLFRGSPQGGSSNPCDVLRDAIKAVKSHFAGSASTLGKIPIHFVVPVTRNTGCKVESEFRKHFGKSEHRFNVFLDIIAIEIPMEIGDVGVRVKVPSWDNIETKVISLTTYVNFEDIYKMDSVLQEYSGWIKSTLQGLQINDVFLLDDTTVPELSTAEESKVKKEKVADALTTTSTKAFGRQTYPPKTSRVRTARGISAENFVPPQPLTQARAPISVTAARSITADQQLTKAGVAAKANDKSSMVRKTGEPAMRPRISNRKNVGANKHFVKGPWEDDPRRVDRGNRKLQWKRLKLTTARLVPVSKDLLKGEVAMQQQASPEMNPPAASKSEDVGSSRTKWNRTFIPLLILIIILALILIFILICCLFLIEAEKERPPSSLSTINDEKSPLLDRQASGKKSSRPAPAPRKKDSVKTAKTGEGESTARGDDGVDYTPIFVSGRVPNRRDGEKGGDEAPLLNHEEIKVSKEGGAGPASKDRPDPDPLSPPKDNMPKITTDHMF